MASDIHALASYQHCCERMEAAWPGFLDRRARRLVEQERHGHAAERVTENILDDLFSTVLDWDIGDVNHQVGFADLVLTRLGIKYLIIEAKRPGALAWNRTAIDRALDQANRYAFEQKVHCIAITDGKLLYARDVLSDGRHRDRALIDLEETTLPESLWWLSVHGIYRARDDAADAVLQLLPEAPIVTATLTASVGDSLLHPKYKLPSWCFAYVGDANHPSTWKLPYLIADGRPDMKRLPKAIQAILSNYRGAKVGSVPESAVPDVLVTLGRAAWRLGHMPSQAGPCAPIYEQLAEVLDQLGRRNEIEG